MLDKNGERVPRWVLKALLVTCSCERGILTFEVADDDALELDQVGDGAG